LQRGARGKRWLQSRGQSCQTLRELGARDKAAGRVGTYISVLRGSDGVPQVIQGQLGSQEQGGLVALLEVQILLQGHQRTCVLASRGESKCQLRPQIRLVSGERESLLVRLGSKRGLVSPHTSESIEIGGLHGALRLLGKGEAALALLQELQQEQRFLHLVARHLDVPAKLSTQERTFSILAYSLREGRRQSAAGQVKIKK
jgi:hypothetical protein